MEAKLVNCEMQNHTSMMYDMTNRFVNGKRKRGSIAW